MVATGRVSTLRSTLRKRLGWCSWIPQTNTRMSGSARCSRRTTIRTTVRRRTIAWIPFGIPRLLRWCIPNYVTNLSKLSRMLPTLPAVSCRRSAIETVGREYDGFRNGDTEVDLLRNVSLAVLSHDPARWSSPAYAAQGQVIWDQMQEELSHLSPHSYRVIAKGSNHYIHVERPELVIQAVRNVYDSAVHNAPLKTLTTRGQMR